MGLLWAMSLPGLVCLLIALATVERFGGWLRRLLPWRRGKAASPASATGLDELTALFYATKHYELEHRKTELMLRDDAEDGDRRFRLANDEDGPVVFVPVTNPQN